MAARIRTVYSKWRVGADDSVRLDDGRTISDRADRVVGPYKGTIDGITVIEREGQSPSPTKQMPLPCRFRRRGVDTPPYGMVTDRIS